MHIKNAFIRSTLSVILLLSVLFSSGAEAWAVSAEQNKVIDGAEIQELFDRYIEEKDLNPDLISVAYYYTATEESWFYNEDSWYYSASLYKVPLMMLLSDKVCEEGLASEALVYGLTFEQIEEAVLKYSDNDIAYSALLYLGDPASVRALYRTYSELPEDYYDWSFYSSSYFTARFMNDVMKTLYAFPDRFSGIVDCLKEAQPEHYFRWNHSDSGYDVAQKYGSYCDENDNNWNHTTGIIYTPNPFILTVMTRYGGISEMIISDLASLFLEYTLSADQRL